MIPKTIQEAKQQILAGTLTLTDLVEQYFTNIDASNEEINAFVYLNKEDALKQAQSIQKKWMPVITVHYLVPSWASKM